MAFKMVFQMTFVPDFCTIKTYGKNSINLYKYGMIWYNII